MLKECKLNCIPLFIQRSKRWRSVTLAAGRVRVISFQSTLAEVHPDKSEAIRLFIHRNMRHNNNMAAFH